MLPHKTLRRYPRNLATVYSLKGGIFTNQPHPEPHLGEEGLVTGYQLVLLP